MEEARDATLPERVREALPPFLLTDAALLAADLEEIRLRRDRPVSLTLGGENRILPHRLDKVTLDGILLRLCGGSLYAFGETIREGYLSLPGNVRVGVYGRSSVENGLVKGLSSVDGLCIRLPRRMRGVGGAICRLARREPGGILLYAPPGGGKTTCLRGVIAGLAGGDAPLRVAVIDTREELAVSGAPLADYLVGYPRGVGIAIATRTLNPQWVVCDEVGEEQEARTILEVQSCGVPLIATAHAGCAEDLLRRPGLRLLHRAGVFRHYVGLRRCREGDGFSYAVSAARDLREE
jgi:stage III sporulation protein AA